MSPAKTAEPIEVPFGLRTLVGPRNYIALGPDYPMGRDNFEGRGAAHSEADLGMFSMFGRTGAPTKRGPHKRTGKFLQHSNVPQIIEIIIRKRFCMACWRQKVSSQVLPAGN